MNPYKQKKRELKKFLHQVNRVCYSLTQLNTMLSAVDNKRIEVTQEAITAARLMLNTVTELNKDLQPKNNQHEQHPTTTVPVRDNLGPDREANQR
jgi:hypothetical protein